MTQFFDSTKVQSDFYNAFCTTTLNNVKATTKIDCSPGLGVIDNKYKEENYGVIYGHISVAIKNIGKVTINICFEKSTILALASAMLSEDYKELSNDVADVVGELTNMITVQAKNILRENGYEFDMAIPSVNFVNNDEVVVKILENTYFVIPFSTTHGEFSIGITAREKKI